MTRRNDQSTDRLMAEAEAIDQAHTDWHESNERRKAAREMDDQWARAAHMDREDQIMFYEQDARRRMREAAEERRIATEREEDS